MYGMTYSDPRAEGYAEHLADASDADVLDALIRASRANQYGSHAEEINIAHTEALHRMGGNR
jgi:hypothetical protein